MAKEKKVTSVAIKCILESQMGGVVKVLDRNSTLINVSMCVLFFGLDWFGFCLCENGKITFIIFG